MKKSHGATVRIKLNEEIYIAAAMYLREKKKSISETSILSLIREQISNSGKSWDFHWDFNGERLYQFSTDMDKQEIVEILYEKGILSKSECMKYLKSWEIDPKNIGL